MGVKTKSFIFIFLILLIPTTIIGIFSYLEAKNGLQYLAKQQMDIQIKNVVDKIRSKLEFVIRGEPELLINEDVLSGMVEDELTKFGISKKSYIFIINNKGRVLLHPKREKKLKRENFLKSDIKSVVEISKKMIEEDSGFGIFKDEDGEKFLSFLKYNKGEVLSGSSLIQPKYNLEWSIGLALPTNEVLIAAKKNFFNIFNNIYIESYYFYNFRILFYK